MKARGAVLASAVVALLAVGTAAHAASGYAYSVVGNPADVTTPTSGLLVLQGGGTDVDENFVRMGARSGPGGGFDIDTWSGTGGISYTLSATAGVLTSSNGSVS